MMMPMGLKDIKLDTRQSSLLMQLAYAAIIEEIHERTERVMRYHYGVKDIKKPFVPPTVWGQPILLPKQRFYRLSQAVWGQRTELIEKEYRQDIARLAELIAIVEELERWFAERKEKAMNESVNAFLGSVKPKKTRKGA